MAGKRKRGSSTRTRGRKRSRRTFTKGVRLRNSAPLAPRGYFSPQRVEKKAWDVNIGSSTTFGFTSGTTPSGGYVQLLNGMATGSDIGQRIGRKVCMRSILIRWTVRASVSPSAYTNSTCRVMLVVDKFANGVTPTIFDILDFSSAINKTADGCVNANMKLENRERFKILMDKVFILHNNGSMDFGSGTNVPSNIYCKRQHKTFKRFNFETLYNGPGSTGTDGSGTITNNAIYLVAYNDTDSTLTANQPNLWFSSRVRFTDI